MYTIARKISICEHATTISKIIINIDYMQNTYCKCRHLMSYVWKQTLFRSVENLFFLFFKNKCVDANLRVHRFVRIILIALFVIDRTLKMRLVDYFVYFLLESTFSIIFWNYVPESVNLIFFLFLQALISPVSFVIWFVIFFRFFFGTEFVLHVWLFFIFLEY